MRILLNGYQNIAGRGKKNITAGSEIFMQSLLKELLLAGHQCTGILIRGKKVPKGTIQLERFTKRGVHYTSAELSVGYRKFMEVRKPELPPMTKRASKLITQLVAAEAPDIIIINGFSLGNWLIMNAGYTLGIPVITLHHGLWYTEMEAYKDKLDITPAGVELARRLEADCMRMATKQIFLSPLSLNTYSKNVTKVGKDALAMPLPYVPVFANKTLPQKSKPKTVRIGMVGRWDPIKNHDAYLQLAKAAAVQGLPWKFYAVTEMTENLALMHLVEIYPQFVTVVAPMPADKLKKFYQKMDILILPSQFEVFATAVMEALLQNRFTIIAKRNGWLPIYKEQGMDDLVVDFKNIPHVLATIKKYAHKAPKKSFIHAIMKEHDPRTIMQAYIAIITSLKTVRHAHRPTRQ